MTKAERIAAGREAGRLWGECFNETDLRKEHNEVLVDVGIAAQVNHWKALDAPYREAFKNAAMATWNNRRNELPDIKAARRLARVRSWIADEREKGQLAVARMLEKVAKATDQNLELRWNCEAAISGSCYVKVCSILESVLNEQGLDATIEAANAAVRRMANDTSFSTNPISNLSERLELAAWAEFTYKASTWWV